MNHKKLYRLYTEEKPGVRRRRGRKRARGSRTPMPVALRPGERPLSVIACNHLPVSGIVGFCVGHVWRVHCPAVVCVQTMRGARVPHVGRE